MAAASYATNLTTMSSLDSTTGVTAIGAGGSLTNGETDFYIQNGLCVSKATAAQWRNGARGGVLYNNNTGITLPTDGAVLFWIYWWGPGVLATKANGGVEIDIGNATTAYNAWYVTGSDDWEFGGWRNYAVNFDVSPDRVQGTPNTTRQYFGWQAVVPGGTAIGKGNPYGIDAIRYGRCDLICTDGDLANGYATFLGAANWNNESTLRYGLLIPRDGAYYLQGLFQFGTSTTAVDFRDNNKPIFIQNTEKVTSNFNTFEVVNASSNVSLDSISVTSLGTTSRGRWLTTDNATVAFNSCSFIDFGTFNFLNNTTIENTTFRRCDQITLGGATITNSQIVRSFATTALLAGSDLSTLSFLAFTSAGTGHAIEITGGTTHTLNNISFTGYPTGTAGTNITTTNTGNEAVYVNVGSGTTVTLNITGGDIPSVRSAGAQINVVSTANVTLTGLQSDSEVRAYVGTDPATSVEIAGVESSGTSFTFGQSFSGQQGYIIVLAFGYVPLYQTITYGSTDVEIPIQQTVDRVYSNPVGA